MQSSFLELGSVSHSLTHGVAAPSTAGGGAAAGAPAAGFAEAAGFAGGAGFGAGGSAGASVAAGAGFWAAAAGSASDSAKPHRRGETETANKNKITH